MQEFSFKVMEDETFAVTGYTGDEKEVVIPDTHWGKPVTVLFDGLFSGHAEIERVRIPDTVTDIGEFVFDGCRNLRQISLPAGRTGTYLAVCLRQKRPGGDRHSGKDPYHRPVYVQGL